MMHELDIKKTARAWLPLAGTIFVPHTDEEYNQIVALLDQLIDEVREDESHACVVNGDPGCTD